ncbi:MAG: dienelactone hydrolase family protein [Hyphomicrobiales bacterium]
MKSYGSVALAAFLALFVCASASSDSSTPLVFDANSVGAPLSNASAELFVPPGAGPFPAIVVLHGCDGIGRHYRMWARQLRAWGYIALLVDSFRPRGLTTICNHGMTVPPTLRAQDAFNAAAYLRSLSNVTPDRIGIIGFSHGGWAILKAVLAENTSRSHAEPFAVAVAFYPGCDPPHSGLVTDTLILVGEADDWTPAKRCAQWRDLIDAGQHTVVLKTYPDARHGFDAPTPPHLYAGHLVGRSPDAAEDAVSETRAFFAAHLMR